MSPAFEWDKRRAPPPFIAYAAVGVLLAIVLLASVVRLVVPPPPSVEFAAFVGGPLIALVVLARAWESRRRFVSTCRAEALDLLTLRPVQRAEIERAEAALRRTGAYKDAEFIGDSRRRAIVNDPNEPSSGSKGRRSADDGSADSSGRPNVRLSLALTFSALLTLASGAVAAARDSYSLAYNPTRHTVNYIQNYGPTTDYGPTYATNHTTNNTVAARTDCLAYFVELDELAEDKPDIAKRLPTSDPRIKACRLGGPAAFRHLVDRLASRP